MNKFRELPILFPRLGLMLLVLLGLSACSTTPPEGVSPVTPFDLTRYEGKWYELARLDHSFERGLSDVSASYRAQPDGSVEVINRGYDTQRSAWRQAVGRALFTGAPNTASLKVSFFGPFYGGYHIAALDEHMVVKLPLTRNGIRACKALSDEGALPAERAAEAIRRYGLDPEAASAALP